MGVLIVSLVVLSALLIAAFNYATQEQEPAPLSATEKFIETWLVNENGTFATYIKRGDEVDEDLVKGRESLSETLGLWMEHALELEDQEKFEETYVQLQEYYLEEDGFVNWKLTEDGESEVNANAFIDDIRISAALRRADNLWEEEKYTEASALINRYLNTNNVRNGIFTDFYETNDQYASELITLSYIEPPSLELLSEEANLDAEAAESTIDVLRNAPMDDVFYPKAYNVDDQEYLYDDEINIVDQAITAYHQGQRGERSEPFLSFIEEQMTGRGVVNGIYSRETKEPLVDYESPAVYSFLILYCTEIGEDSLAQDIFQRMKEFQVKNKNSDYYGGFGVTDGDTHIFDNLLPIIAEERMNSQ
ncbi:glycosyl hydrolase family 8 [Alkalicoccus halolimnae]|uniref:Glycosyl hydrolase family 8 n=1 Tax=Alkalicoccus halolimnae TaxID=1667239 RepID=A0A5C7FFU1_9BACI|nr:glycosyl hydrolase family 8 [Alkalicoccus halolimnae]TXF81686.1 hypothetical protein FTX54_15640 [Alkalicoccus halolimnae]